jgi:PAS domain S-box-containing protein
LWKRSITEVTDKPIFDVLTEARDQGFRELLDNVYDTGIPFVAEELPMNLLKNGTLENSFVKFAYEPLRDTHGSIKGVMAIAIDITEQVVTRKKIEESEKHFRQLADMMPAKISNADVDGNVLYFNKKWLDFTGKNFDELKDLGYQNIMHPDEREEFSRKFLYANETKTPLKMEIRFLDKYGQYKWHLNNASPVINEDGNITMWVGSTTEIHDQITQKELLKNAVKERTNQLVIANKELVYQNIEKEKKSAELGIANTALAFQNEEKEKISVELTNLNKELHSFTYIASHDLQEPLRKIKIFTERIMESEVEHLSDDGKNYFNRIQNSVDRMQQLIEDLLSFSRTGTGDRKLIYTDLKVIIDDVKEDLKDTIEEKNVLIEIGQMCHANIIVFQFRQLMYNLISNAIKFSVPGIAPHILINSRIIKGSELQNKNIIPKKMYCHISVKDNGIGFEPEYSTQIFEMFQRLHGKEEYKGTGIGLAIVKKIVENHNGIITATSNLGEGATFDIYLPVIK